MVDIDPALPEKVEQMEAERNGPRDWETIPKFTASGEEIPAAKTENVVPLFATDADYYNNLADLNRALTGEESDWLEGFYNTDTGRAFLEMDGRLKTVNEGNGFKEGQ